MRKIEAAFDKVDAIDKVTKAFCGSTSEIRPRYAVALYLIVEKNGIRTIMNVRRSTNIEYNDWALSLDLKLMYEELELQADPKFDSTKKNLTFFESVLLYQCQSLEIYLVQLENILREIYIFQGCNKMYFSFN